MPFINFTNPPNINNKIQNIIIKNDLNNSSLKIWLKQLYLNLENPKLIHISCWFHLFLAHFFKKNINKVNIKIYSLPIKNGKKDENNKTGNIPKA